MNNWNRSLLLILLLPFAGFSQTKTVQEYIDQVTTLTNRADVKAANDYIDRNKESILREWIAITEINAPSGHEQPRAKYIEKLLRSYQLDEVRYDSAGNLIAVRKGTGGGPRIVFDAHLDTVFQPGLQIKATVRDGKVYAPGVGDDTRNIEALLATIRALNEAKIKTKGDLIFVFTVEEETTFKGVNAFIQENKGKVDHYIALDGGYEGFTYAGIGINWYRHHFIGPGGHTRSRTPPYSATLPLARAIDRIYQLKVPTNPSSNLNIGMLGGAEVVNAKAADAWFTVDLRSTSNDVLADLEEADSNDSQRRSRARRDDRQDRRDLKITGGIDSRTPRVLSRAHVRSRASRDGIRSAHHKRRLEQFQSGSDRRHLLDLHRRRPV